jgi:peptide/nickel transport system permease protein
MNKDECSQRNENEVVELSQRRPRSWVVTAFTEALRNKVVIIGFAIAGILILVTTLAPILPLQSPEEIIGGNRLLSPNLHNLFGTDNLGRDVLSRVIFGMRTSLIVSLSSIFLGMFFGAILGMITGYLGGRIDDIVCRILDVFFGIPTMLLAIALSAMLGTGILNPIVAIAIINIPFFARLVRGPTLVEKTKQYIQAARAIGAPTGRIIFRYILPNVIPLVIVQGTVSLSYAILIEASLGFVGLGVQPPIPSLGNILSEGRTYLELAPWFSAFPGLAIMIMVLAFNLVGDGLRDALDPMMRGRM